MTELEAYYNKFNEEKRLLRPYGRVEYLTTMKYIHDAIDGRTELKILDVGAGTGRYAVPLSEEGHEVTAVELVKYNLGILKQKGSKVIAKQGNALNLKKYPSDSFDIVLELGPMYHLMTEEEQVKALQEAKRVVKPGGIILVAYCMNEFAILTYGFKEKHVIECLENGKFTEDFRCNGKAEDLYHYIRLEDIERLNMLSGLKRVKIVTSDGPANYMRREISDMNEAEFEAFMRYHLSTCERSDILGACEHTLDILTKES